ncbi:MAG TPA: hypothetical protein VKM94_04510 [Blastocatellia bacterium]|nr:hypothetical protein [Blastocatellia bacterium]
MTIPQKRSFALIKSAPVDDLKGGVLVIEERELWRLIVEWRFKDHSTIRYAMDTIYCAAEEILQGSERESLIRRVELLSGLSSEAPYSRLIAAVVAGFQSGDRAGLLAAQSTALCAVLMMSETQHIWPRNWDSPSYKRPLVWRPESARPTARRRRTPVCPDGA